jgi:polysaccharide pyruvyl transferase WcaK-like protein
VPDLLKTQDLPQQLRIPVQKGRACYRVGVFGHYGHRNLGDEAITEAVIQNLRRRCATVQLAGFSMDPEDTARRYGIPAYRIRRQKSKPPENAGNDESSPGQKTSGAQPANQSGMREYLKRFATLRLLVRAARFVVGLPRELWREAVFLRDSYRVAKDIDSFIVAGSNQFLDNFGGVWGFPYTVLKWTVLARCAGARVIFLSVGAGPIASLWSRIMVRGALLLADYVSFRDDGSRRLIEWAGSGKKWRVYPDLAQSLEIGRHAVRGGSRPPVVGINPMPVYDPRTWCERNDQRYERYVGQLARFVSRLLRERFPVFFFTTHPSDVPVIDDVLTRLDPDVIAASGPPGRKTSNTVKEVMGVLASADIVVATRYHGTVLGLHAGRPVLGICYYRKTREVLQSMGQDAYAVAIDELDHEDLWRRFDLLVSRQVEEARTIECQREVAVARLAEQYDTVLRLLRAPTELTHESI